MKKNLTWILNILFKILIFILVGIGLLLLIAILKK